MGVMEERRSLADDDDEDSEDEEMSPLKLRKKLQEDEGELEEGLVLPSPPDGGWGWVVVAASFLCNMILDGIAYSFGVLLAPLCRYFDAPAGTVSWVGSMLCGMYLMSGPIVGGLVNKYGCRPVCIAGSIITSIAFSLSTLATNVPMLMVLYGVLGGFGLGLIYLPAVVAVGYYFESKRALATGISVCGSGVGTFIFAPLASWLLEKYGWKGANIIFAALCLQCAVFGALMRPLSMSVMVEEEEEDDPVLKMKLPDGQSLTGFRTSIASDSSTGELSSPSMLRIPLPTITEQSVTAAHSKKEEHHSVQDVFPSKAPVRKISKTRFRTTSECVPEGPLAPILKSPSSSKGKIPRNQSAPHFAHDKRNYSTTFTPMARVGSRGSQLGYTVGSGSQLCVEGAGSARGLNLTVKPLARKDIFYSRSIYSVHKIGEEESKKAQSSGGLRPNMSYISMQQGTPGLRSNKQSFVSIHRGSLVNSSLGLPVSSGSKRRLSLLSDARAPSVVQQEGGGMLAVLKEMMNFKLLADPIFLLVGVSNAVAMIGFYTPFVYLPNMAVATGVSVADASFLVSVIGISNTLGRVLAGWVSDFEWVNPLVMTNVAIILSAFTVAVFPLCTAYWTFTVCALAFGFFVAAYISLTSIVLVELMGLDNLTSAFGLLTLFRGFSSMIGPPINGWIFESTSSYDVSFYVSGAFLLLAGIISCLVDLLKRRRDRLRHEERQKVEAAED